MAFRLPPMQAREAFAAAARQQSFLKAADELCVTQSAISHRIKQLEDDLGVRPFLCLNRNIVLTPPGEAYLAGIRAALADIERAPPAIARGARRAARTACQRRAGDRQQVAGQPPCRLPAPVPGGRPRFCPHRPGSAPSARARSTPASALATARGLACQASRCRTKCW